MSKDKFLSMLQEPKPESESKPRKENKTIREIRKESSDDDKILRHIRAIIEPEEDYYKPIKIANVFDDNFIDYESNGDRNKMLSIK